MFHWKITFLFQYYPNVSWSLWSYTPWRWNFKSHIIRSMRHVAGLLSHKPKAPQFPNSLSSDYRFKISYQFTVRTIESHWSISLDMYIYYWLGNERKLSPSRVSLARAVRGIWQGNQGFCPDFVLFYVKWAKRLLLKFSLPQYFLSYLGTVTSAGNFTKLSVAFADVSQCSRGVQDISRLPSDSGMC